MSGLFILECRETACPTPKVWGLHAASTLSLGFQFVLEILFISSYLGVTIAITFLSMTAIVASESNILSSASFCCGRSLMFLSVSKFSNCICILVRIAALVWNVTMFSGSPSTPVKLLLSWVLWELWTGVSVGWTLFNVLFEVVRQTPGWGVQGWTMSKKWHRQDVLKHIKGIVLGACAVQGLVTKWAEIFHDQEDS